MSADPITSSDPSPRLISLPPANLWFGFAGSVVAWILLGCSDIVITWRACMHQENFGIPSEHPAVSWLFFAVTLLLLAVTVSAGVTSYRNWRWLSQQRQMLESLAVQRGEFMAVVGVIVSVTLSMGVVWLALPPLFLDLCWRAK